MCKHFVRFYEDAYPADEASDFIAAGLLAGDACIVILIKPLREAVEQRLNARGISTGPEGSCLGSFSAIDTHEALSQLMVDGRLDKERAAETLGFVLSQAAQGGSRRVRLVGDPAPALYAAGNQQDAIALERLVDHLATVHSASVFCAYPIQGFCREGSTNSLFRICAQHSALEFPKGLWVYGYLESAATHRPDLGLVH